jgi:hypothetical protein
MEKMKIIFFILFVNTFILNHLFSNEIIQNSSLYNHENEENVLDKPIRGVHNIYPLLFGKIGCSFLGDYNITIGLDLVFLWQYHWEGLGWPEHIIGLDYQYQFTEKDSILRLDYTYVLAEFFTIGLSNRYNVNKQQFGIAPKIGLHVFPMFFMLNIDYRYNIIMNNWDKNFHEITFSFSIPLVFLPDIFEYIFRKQN